MLEIRDEEIESVERLLLLPAVQKLNTSPGTCR